MLREWNKGSKDGEIWYLCPASNLSFPILLIDVSSHDKVAAHGLQLLDAILHSRVPHDAFIQLAVQLYSQSHITDNHICTNPALVHSLEERS
jgi:hypothetical protein